MRKYLVIAIPLVWLTGCGDLSRDAETPASPAPVPVHVVTVTTEDWPAFYQATGTIRARSSATISAKWMGYVREVKFQVGDRVREGQLLVTLDARDLDASAHRVEASREEVRNAIPEADSAVAAARTNFDLAQVTFRRMNQLYEKRSISDQEFDESSAKMKAAQAAFDMARARRTQLDAKLAQAEQEVQAAQITRSYAEITAPFAGTITVKSVEPGNLAVPGAPLLTIEGEGYRLEASVEESKHAAIHLGQAVSVAIDAAPAPQNSRVAEIVPAVDAASRAYTVKIDLPASTALRSGMFGRAAFQLGSRAVIAVPVDALQERGQLQSVYVAEHGFAHTRLVTLGEKSNGKTEVLSGLTAGDQVIMPVPSSLADGARIEVRP